MPRNRAFVFAIGLASAAVAVPALVSCLSDPREEDKDVPTPVCDANNYKTELSSDPANAESSLRNYVQATLELKQQTDEVEAQLMAACNNLAAAQPMIPPFADATPKQNVKDACKRIADRLLGINATAPDPNPPNAAAAQVRIAPSCAAAPGALETCLATCGAKDCTPGKCAPEQRSQKCAGTCNGKCQTVGDKPLCKGVCSGSAKTDLTQTPPVAQITCAGECTGVCTAQAWQGKCEGACSGQFIGFCGGTCTGACITDPSNPAGTPANPEALGDGGTLPPLTVVPTGKDGNCLGLCAGVCSSGADGVCQGLPCFTPPVTDPDLSKLKLAPFNGSCIIGGSGTCLDPALVGGAPGATCFSAEGTGVAGPCNGTCEENVAGAACDGRCLGECQGSATDVTCTGAPNCGQNAECTNACSALVALQTSTACQDSTFEAFALHDPTLLAAWRTLGVQFTKPIQRIQHLRNALSFVGNQAYGNFVSVGLKGEFIRSCVEFGAANAKAANDKLLVLTAVNPTR